MFVVRSEGLKKNPRQKRGLARTLPAKQWDEGPHIQRAEGKRICYRSTALITSRASRRSSLARLWSCRSRTSCARAWHGPEKEVKRL